ncbi:MAG TPA: M28 family peptidase [Gemmatimonadaceae bacterium]|nr:M28 family peptidase [Gemmatimonadaceae bacterium]
MRHFRTTIILASLLPAAAGAQAASGSAAAPCTCAAKITANEIDGDLAFLASDLLEGRAPATRGGQLTSAYLAAQLRSAGVLPGVNGSYFQTVPIDVVAAVPASIRVTASGKATAALSFPDQVVVGPGSASDSGIARGELVFVGYGAAAPEYHWDDYKGEDLKGKVLLVLVNDPPAPPSEPTLFGGKAMTYYGRWTYKYEEAERRGAAGVLIVHTTEAASYPWHTVVGSWGKEVRMLPRDPSLPAPLGVRGWITDSAASALLAQAGLNMAELRARADTRAFAPVHTGIMMDMSFKNTVAHLQSENVVGLVRGSDAKLKDQYVVYSAHWDHLGIGPAVNGDSIYNGAADNASGTAGLLAIARASVRMKPTRRSQLFVFVTAEESGLLGSDWFARHPPAPAKQIVADLNMDVLPLEGRVKDLAVLGADKSTLGQMLAHLAQTKGLRLSPDPHPEAGHFYRSDHFSFAKVGVPSISIGGGTDYVGRPKGWGEQQQADYTAHRYHQPSDEYRADFDLSGAVQISQLVLTFGRALGDSPVVPVWNATAEFKAARDATGGPGK